MPRLSRLREGFLLPALLLISLGSILMFQAMVVLYSAYPLTFHVALGTTLSAPLGFLLAKVLGHKKMVQMQKTISRLEREMLTDTAPDSSLGSQQIPSSSLSKPNGYIHWLTANLHLWTIKEGFVSQGRCQFCNSELPLDPGAEFDPTNHADDCPLTVAYEDILSLTNRFNTLLSRHVIEK